MSVLAANMAAILESYTSKLSPL